MAFWRVCSLPNASIAESTPSPFAGAAPPVAIAPADKSAGNASDGLPSGLTHEEAAVRLKKFGANAMPDASVHPLR
jgi:hypothetical protein